MHKGIFQSIKQSNLAAKIATRVQTLTGEQIRKK
jgi:hypothetical protein